MTRPDALIFDFDGLICDTEACLLESARKVFARFGAPFPSDKWLDTIGTASPRNFWIPWLEEGVGDSIDEREALAEFEEHNRVAVAQLVPNRGVVELLDIAQEEGIAVGIASSSSRSWVSGLLDQLGIGSRFAHLLTRDDVTHAKPAPDLYLLAAERFATQPRRCIAFEDSFNGSLAAVRAGMPCVVVPSELTTHQDLSHASHRVGHLGEVTMALLRRLNANAA